MAVWARDFLRLGSVLVLLAACGGGETNTGGGSGGDNTGGEPDTSATGGGDATIEDSAGSEDGGSGDAGDTAVEPTDTGETIDGTLPGDVPDTGPDVSEPPDQGPETHSPDCTSDSQCSDGDPCTYDVCAAGTCQNPPNDFCATNSPCVESPSPGANDPDVVDCVCAMDDYCCTTAWDGLCVSQADEQCGAPCACGELSPEELGCLSNSDCTYCDDGNPCDGSWGCIDGTCQPTPPVVCDDSLSTGCVENICSPFTGLCELTANFETCNDNDACTQDSCAANGDCTNLELPGCGENHPCEAAQTPASKDDGITACVCLLDPYCCATAWDTLCVSEAQVDCGAQCDCSVADAESLACEEDADCGYCNDPFDQCAGQWTCDEGTCVDAGQVVCDDSEDIGCLKNTCNAATGICSVIPVLADCDDSDVCTADACDVETGECANDFLDGCGENHPCEVASTPGTKDPDVNTCVCDFEPFCCDVMWDGYCTFLAQDMCAVSCDCSTFEVEDLECELDSDCTFCDPDGNLCNGTWSCLDGTCAESPAVECDTSGDVGCSVTACAPSTGQCAAAQEPGTCVDGDPCTFDGCELDTGNCANEPIPGCGENHPCQTAQTPGANDPVIEECVCLLDPYCCEVAWDGICVGEAENDCGSTCDCAAAPEGDLVCEEDADCGFCDPDGNLCNGTWTCQEGTCATDPPVDCGGADGDGCLLYKCIASTGECDFAPVDAYCSDGDSCTIDMCDAETGACDYQEGAPGCASTDPCVPADTPASNTPSVNACVCAMVPECCTDSWWEFCVELAMFECQYPCTCKKSPPDCGEDADCADCDDGDPCNGEWYCEDGTCAELPPVVCEPDGETGCLLPGCDPETGGCDYFMTDAACDDLDSCTSEVCGDDGLCTFTPIENCGGGGGEEPPFPPFPGEPTPTPGG